VTIGHTVAEMWRFIDFSKFSKIYKSKTAAAAIFQDDGCGRLGFLNFRNFNGWNVQWGQTESLCQISWRSVKFLLRYGDFSNLQN